ncbi:hypothetical protein [Helicobacter canis]|uniref:Uncharacterized protein n=1 Tax=Helicobacter canis NCTC 12740 TaxID=1357399 RepID=V8CKE9_9HELI|nr:hypothetical protein [Helicobacter canis]ETD27868.1 hypothetical protein HMPREF2087_00792 [Helicobacter canis NCTC 12740]
MKPKSLKSTASKLSQMRTKLTLTCARFYTALKPKMRQVYRLLDKIIDKADKSKVFCKQAHTYATTLLRTLLAQCLAKRNALITLALLVLSVGFGLWSVFVLGILYERQNAHQESLRKAKVLESSAPTTLPTSPPKQARPQTSTPSKSNIGMGDSLQALSTKPPAIPAPDEKESVIAGNLTYTNAISIAKSNLLAQDFTRARIWLYRAFLLHNGGKEVWELYWLSFEQDYHASIEQKQAAYTLYLQAKRYYGF